MVINEGCNNALGFSDKTAVHGGPAPPEGEAPVEGDYFDGVFKYIQQMLMEEDDLEYIPNMFQDCMALQAAEKSFHDALTENHPPPSPTWTQIIDPSCNSVPDQEVSELQFPVPGSQISETGLQPRFPLSSNSCSLVPGQLEISSNTSRALDISSSVNGCQLFWQSSTEGNTSSGAAGNRGRNEGSGPSSPPEGKRNHNRDGGGGGEERNNKQFAAGSSQEPERTEKYDKVLLCPSMNPAFYDDAVGYYSDESSHNEGKSERYLQGPKRGRPRGSKKGAKAKAIVDLTDLLARCAQVETVNDKPIFQERLAIIRQHSS